MAVEIQVVVPVAVAGQAKNPGPLSPKMESLPSAGTCANAGKHTYSADPEIPTATVTTTSNTTSSPTPTPSPPRHRSRSQKEANQSRYLHASRLQRTRASTTGSIYATKALGKPGRFKHHSLPAEGLGGVGGLNCAGKSGPGIGTHAGTGIGAGGAALHEQHILTKMAYAEQQKWITVQQKTFTKWLNTKIESRDLEVKDLVKDLSDGVRVHDRSSP